jgi:hypothetical protein
VVDTRRRTTLRLYSEAIWKHWGALVTGIVAALLGFVFTAFPSLVVPAGVWATLAILSLGYAQFAAYHDLRVARDRLAVGADHTEPAYQRIGFKAVLGEAEDTVWRSHSEGESVSVDWAESMRAFLEAALGPGEANRFARDFDMEDESGDLVLGFHVNPFTVNKWMDSLLARADMVAIRPDFNPDEWQGKFS